MYGDLTDTLGKAKDFFNLEGVKIDNWMFRLHYVASSILFIGYSAVVTMNTYAGDPIDCLHAKEDQEEWGDYLDWFCFIHGTQSLKYPRKGEAHDTIGFFDCINSKGLETGGDCVETHPHYMWVALVVLIQAGISYLPRYLWYSWEGGKMNQLLGTILKKPKFFHETGKAVCRRSEAASRQDLHICSSGNELTEELAKNYLDSVGDNSYYALKFSSAEWLCLLVCLVQYALTDWFLNNSFLSYGAEVLTDINLDPAYRSDPMERTLPIVTSCTLPKFGSAGSLSTTQSICVLPNNIVHQGFYLFLWFWLLFVTSVTFIHQVYRLALYFVPGFRAYVTKKMWTVTEADNDVDGQIKALVDKTCYSDWIVLSFFHTNLTTVNFQNFLEDLAYNYKEKGTVKSK